MPSPTGTLEIGRPDISAALVDFDLQADHEKFIGTKVLPAKNVPQIAGVAGRIPAAQLLRMHETRRNPGAMYNRADWKFDDYTWACDEHGFEVNIDERQASSGAYGEYFDLEMHSARYARHVVLQNYEARVAAKIFDAGTFTPTAVSTEWSTVATSTPITDVKAARERLWSATGLDANALVMNWHVFENLRLNTQILEKVQYVARVLPGDINVDHLRAAFNLPMIIVAGGAKNTDDTGNALDITDFWSSEYVALLRVQTGNGPYDVGVGHTFHYTGDGSQMGSLFETYYSVERRSNVVRARMDTQEKIIYPECVQLLSNITA